ncbi:MAG: AAA family ATPase [Gammaproteobacteria bacterium]|nr:MAG: AAA family ATPase [Gammaproteobacteria bacterium]
MNNNNKKIYYLPQKNEIKLFEYAYKNQLPLLIKGPTGCGKTRFIEYMAQKLNLPTHTVSCHDDLTATDLVGRYLIGEGKTIWQDGPLTSAVRNGGICYLDEIVEARKDTTVVIHPLSDDRRILPIERTGETLKAPDNFMLVVSYNPGYQNLLKGLKPSTLQRFLSITFSYLKSNDEIEVVIEETGAKEITAKKLVLLANSFRSLQDFDIAEGASTRLVVYAAALIESGFSEEESILSAMVEPLTDDTDTIDALMEIVRATI